LSFSPTLYSGKTVVLTGAGRGIGKAALLAFHQAGANIIAHVGREQHYAKDLPADIQSFVGDLLDRDQQNAFIQFVSEHAAQIDVLVNNAGTMFGRFPADQITDDEYLNIVELNQTAVVRITRGLIAVLARSDNGAMINTVSISASTGGSPGSSIYSATKAFVSTYTKALAKELAPQGIRANAVSPGVIDTDFHQRYSNAEKLEKTKTLVPLQRLGTAEDCAPAYLFLGSHELSGYITGQVLEINGGLA
jgi:NAD(P)-dependent dehydrogenase (short-subunit alcohol dehydrogenase family)